MSVFKTLKSTHSSVLLLLLSLIILQGCSTSVDSRKDSSSAQKNSLSIKQPSINSATDKLIKEAATSSVERAIALLLQSSISYLDQNQADKALYISHQLEKLPLNKAQLALNNLNIAQSLFLLGELSLAQQQLIKIQSAERSNRELLLRAELATQQNMPVKAIISYLYYYQKNSISSNEQIDQLAELFSSLKPYQLKALEKSRAPGLLAWVKFNNIIVNYFDRPISLDFQFKKWKSEYPIHPLNTKIEEVTEIALEFKQKIKYSRIAIIIPLSGREQKLGKTLQAGILAANNFDSTTELFFYDSNQLAMDGILNNIKELKPDAVIGPLLKRHVNAYLTQTQAIKNNESISWISLLLNTPENHTLLDNQFVLSMLPENEASQAAFSLSKKGYKKALVLSQNTNIGKRMASAFIEQWQLQTGITPSVIYYPDGKEMQKSVKTGLDVNFSENRITAMKSKMKESIETETRNRRDIDVIYIFSTSNQAKLLKPYIDVNISPFADNISIYASSRSNNDSKNKNTRRDLTGLTFTEVPWLLSGKQINTDLATQANTIWPKRSNSLERIYALGIDSLQLINKVDALNRLPMLRHKGEIGSLQMDADHIITRSLDWGRYRSSRVQPVEMD